MGWVESINLYDKVPRSVALEPNYSQELKAKTKEALLAHELFSGTPPWEAIKTLQSLLDGSDLELGLFDTSRAHFMPIDKRELYIEIPSEDRKDGDGDVV
eukprot:4946222-Heterocapsa_arctica.AAC.1